MTEAEEHELYLQMKELPDFSSFPLPQSWYKRYNIEQPGLINPKEFIESGYTLKKQYERKDLPPITKGPLKDAEGNIRLLPFLEPQKIEVQTITRPYRNDGEFNPEILPGLIDFGDPSFPIAQTETAVAPRPL